MREIKFRGKRLEDGKWIYGDLINISSESLKILLTRKITTDTTFDNNKVYIANIITMIEVDPDTVGEFTGLHDINGNEIYEGDIVRYKTATGADRWDDENYFCYKIGVVKYKNGEFYPRPIEDVCEDEWYSFYVWDLEVIGNIYENPELLKEER